MTIAHYAPRAAFGVGASLLLLGCAGSAPPSPTVPLPELGSPPAAGVRNVPPFQLVESAVATPPPHLSDLTRIRHKGETVTWMAKTCVDVDGKVGYIHVLASFSGAEPDISNVVRTWRYQPRPEPACTLLRFEFSIR